MDRETEATEGNHEIDEDVTVAGGDGSTGGGSAILNLSSKQQDQLDPSDPSQPITEDKSSSEGGKASLDQDPASDDHLQVGQIKIKYFNYRYI